MRLPHLIERENGVDPGHDASVLDERPDVLHQFGGESALVFGRAGTQGGTAKREPAPDDRPDVDLGRLAKMAGDEDKPAVGPQQVELLLRVGSGLCVENDVDAFAACQRANFFFPLALVVDRGMRADIETDLPFLGRTRRSIDGGVPQPPGDLDAGHSHAAGSALNEERLASSEPSEPDDVVPRGEEHFRQGGSLNEGEAAWY